jgi:hypothetical protein
MVITTTHRVIDRIHRVTGHVRTASHPTAAPGFTEALVEMVTIRQATESGAATSMNLSVLTGGKRNDDVVTIAALHRRGLTGRANQLTTLARVQLNVVDR